MTAEPLSIVLGSQSQGQNFRKVKHGNFSLGRAANLQVELTHSTSRDQTIRPSGYRTGNDFIDQRCDQIRVRGRQKGTAAPMRISGEHGSAPKLTRIFSSSP